MSRKRVLIVDDSALVLGILDDAFSAGGYETLSARNGREALEVLQAERPDLVLSDIVMPDMDGWKLFEEIRLRPELDVVPFMFLTQEKGLATKIRALKLGAQDYITKPFATEEILARADRVMERTVLRPKPASAAPPPLSGHSAQIPVVDLLQLLAINRKTGVVNLDGKSSGQVFLKDGRIVNALGGRARGRKALFRIFGWEDVAFRLDELETVSVAEEIVDSASRVLVEGLVERDEFHRLMEGLPGSDAVLVTKPAGARGPRGDPSGVDSLVLACARRPTSLGEILEEVAATDATIARSVESLIRRGLIEVR